MKKINRCFAVAAFACGLLLSGAVNAQTYNSVTNVSGTSTVGGINVTVTSVGLVTSTSCAGITQPYVEGQDATPVNGVGGYTWNFSVPVSGVQIHMDDIDIFDDVTISINGVPYFLTSANVSALPGGTGCTPFFGTAVAFNGNLLNSGNGFTNAAIVTITPGFAINSVTIVSQGGGSGNGVANDFTFAQDVTPSFNNGSIQLSSICESSPADDVSAMLATTDTDPGQTITWSLATAPMNGTLTGLPQSAASGGSVAPTGVNYTPTAGFNGFDTLVVAANDGVNTALDTLVITVKPKPVLSSPTSLPDLCSGSVFNYTPLSPVAGTTFAWNRPFIGGIANPAATGTGNPMETLDNITYYNLTVTYVYTQTAQGCMDTENVTVTVLPHPTLSSLDSETICSGSSVNYVPMSNGSPIGIYNWTRAAVAGITPATGSGTGAITETLTNTTSSPISVVYTFNLDINGCTAVRTVTVTVNPPASGVTITTKPGANVCAGTAFQNFGASAAPAPGIIYTWSATNATIDEVSNNGQYALVSFHNPGTAVITLSSNITGGGCTNSADNDTVTVSTTELVPASIIYYNYQLVYLDNTANSYQWGYDDAATLVPTTLAGQTFQSYVVATTPDFNNKYYWVMVTKNGCTQKVYYNPPVAVSNVNNAMTMKVYPNPASSMVTIDLGKQQGTTTDISVTDMLGQTIKKVSTTGNSTQLNIADMPAGLYLVSCTQNGVRVATGRFTKN